MTVETDYDLVRIAHREIIAGALRFEVLAAHTRQGEHMQFLVTSELATRQETDIVAREMQESGQPTEFGNAIIGRLRYLQDIDARLHDTNRQIIVVYVPTARLDHTGPLHHTLMGMPIEVAQVIQATVTMYW